MCFGGCWPDSARYLHAMNVVSSSRLLAQGVKLPSLVEVLEGKNQGDGAVYIKWEPGSTNVYSGGGYVIAQMIIEVLARAVPDLLVQQREDPVRQALHRLARGRLVRRGPSLVARLKSARLVGCLRLALGAHRVVTR